MITIKTNTPSDIFIAINTTKRNGGLSSSLPLQGWTQKEGFVKFNGYHGPEDLNNIWEKRIVPWQVI